MSIISLTFTTNVLTTNYTICLKKISICLNKYHSNDVIQHEDCQPIHLSATGSSHRKQYNYENKEKPRSVMDKTIDHNYPDKFYSNSPGVYTGTMEPASWNACKRLRIRRRF